MIHLRSSIDAAGVIRSTSGGTPAEVAAALAGAYQGRDSPQWIAVGIEDAAKALASNPKLARVCMMHAGIIRSGRIER